MLTQAGGGPRRPELVSEAEIRTGTPTPDDLDFDSQVFDGYTAADGGPGPDQAPEWEDADQPEADVAAALGMELAELRQLRTPVPMRPSGMMPVTGREPALPAVGPNDLATSREPALSAVDPMPAPPSAAVFPSGLAGQAAVDPVDDGWNVDLDDPPLDEATVTAPVVEGSDLTVRNELPSEQPAPPPPRRSPTAEAFAPRPMPTALPHLKLPMAPSFGAQLRMSSGTPHLPWILVGALSVAVLTLLVYIVIR
jgi:hypothetical protein